MVDCNTGPGPSAALVLQELRHGWQLRPLTLAMGICWKHRHGRSQRVGVSLARSVARIFLCLRRSSAKCRPRLPDRDLVSKIVFVWLMHVQVARCTFVDPEAKREFHNADLGSPVMVSSENAQLEQVCEWAFENAQLEQVFFHSPQSGDPPPPPLP